MNMQVQIDITLYVQLLDYFVGGKASPELEGSIRQGLEDKLNRQLSRQLYTEYKRAPTDAERMQRWQEYLNGRKNTAP